MKLLAKKSAVNLVKPPVNLLYWLIRCRHV